MTSEELKPGQRIRVVQTIDHREGEWRTAVEGVVHSVELQKTGSWYAHAKDDKLWLRRARLIKDDGEITILNVDSRTEVELLAAAAPQVEPRP